MSERAILRHVAEPAADMAQGLESVVDRLLALAGAEQAAGDQVDRAIEMRKQMVLSRLIQDRLGDRGRRDAA